MTLRAGGRPLLAKNRLGIELEIELGIELGIKVGSGFILTLILTLPLALTLTLTFRWRMGPFPGRMGISTINQAQTKPVKFYRKLH
jgi:hypothetical protein